MTREAPRTPVEPILNDRVLAISEENFTRSYSRMSDEELIERGAALVRTILEIREAETIDYPEISVVLQTVLEIPGDDIAQRSPFLAQSWRIFVDELTSRLVDRRGPTNG